jgi:hypothetical protein
LPIPGCFDGGEEEAKKDAVWINFLLAGQSDQMTVGVAAYAT